MLSALNALLLLAVAYVLRRSYAIWRILHVRALVFWMSRWSRFTPRLQSVKGVPVQFVLIQPLTPLAILLPHGRWNPGKHHTNRCTLPLGTHS